MIDRTGMFGAVRSRLAAAPGRGETNVADDDAARRERADLGAFPPAVDLSPRMPTVRERVRDFARGFLGRSQDLGATFRADDGQIIQAAPRALLAQLLPPALGMVVADVLMPRVFTESAFNLITRGQAGTGAGLQGEMRVSTGKGTEALHLTSMAVSPAVHVSSSDRDFRVGLETAQDGTAQFVVDGNLGGRRGRLSIPVRAWSNERGESVSNFQVASNREMWTVNATPAVQNLLATLCHDPSMNAPDGVAVSAGAVQKLLRDANPLPVQHLTVRAESLNRHGHRVTNEVSTAFPRFTIRGGGYLGVGSQQNYDHITQARSDAAFLVDLDKAVSADHRGLLSLVGQSRDATHFLQMLFGIRLSPEQQMMPAAEFIRTILAGDGRRRPPELLKSPDLAYQKEVCDALKTRLSPAEMADVQRIMKEAHSVLRNSWASAYADGKQGQWLTDPERFNHLKYLQNAGRIKVLQGSLSGKKMMGDLTRALERWNEGHSPPIQINAMYLSNAEGWSGNEYQKMLVRMQKLPLNPEGVILRTGGEIKGVMPGRGMWRYQTMTMRDFLTIKRAHTINDLDRAIGDANARHALHEAGRLQLLKDKGL